MEMPFFPFRWNSFQGSQNDTADISPCKGEEGKGKVRWVLAWQGPKCVCVWGCVCMCGCGWVDEDRLEVEGRGRRAIGSDQRNMTHNRAVMSAVLPEKEGEISFSFALCSPRSKLQSSAKFSQRQTT